VVAWPNRNQCSTECAGVFLSASMGSSFRGTRSFDCNCGDFFFCPFLSILLEKLRSFGLRSDHLEAVG
jgi:hypothetical protein